MKTEDQIADKLSNLLVVLPIFIVEIRHFFGEGVFEKNCRKNVFERIYS